MFRYKIKRKGATWGEKNPRLTLPSFLLLLPPNTFLSPALADCIPHSTGVTKNCLRVFGLSVWNTNVDTVIHGNHTTDKTKRWIIMSPESLQGKYKLKILLTECFFLFCYCWGGCRKLRTMVSSISRKTLMYSWTTTSEELGIFRSLHKDKLISFHWTGGCSAFTSCSYHNFSSKSFLN